MKKNKDLICVDTKDFSEKSGKKRYIITPVPVSERILQHSIISVGVQKPFLNKHPKKFAGE